MYTDYSEEDHEYIQLRQMQNNYRNMPYNKQRVLATEEALGIAGNLSVDSRATVLYDLAWAYALGDDGAKALPVCVEFLALAEEYPHVVKRNLECPSAAMIAAVMSRSLPQISLKQCSDLMEQFHVQVKKYGVGERLWQMHAASFRLRIGQREEAEEHFRLFLATERDDMSDCKACEACNAAEFLMEVERDAEAHQMLKPVLEGFLTCEQQPWSILSIMINDALSKKNFEKAKEYGKMLSRKKMNRRNDLQYISALLRLNAFEQPEKAVKLLEKGINWSIGMWEQNNRLEFYRGAFIMCIKLAERAENIPMALSKRFPCYREDGLYDGQGLGEWFWEQAVSIAKTFDRRIGSDYYMKKLYEKELLDDLRGGGL